ncbi:TPA: hypothetical protein N0F65_004335 [Lagenidium giganteum]|uniref:FYVE-type domain-containing protein n=1 Tax=Lagenidium giganteum TaxID=4803 RepID=A0AAV2YKG2_9STRA|nr:TPA: hypothetical protein N0F65_004335 [Lagenidium giganteum]
MSRFARTADLSHEEAATVTRLADLLLRDLIDSYEHHAFSSQMQVDKKRWKLLKKKDQLAVYKLRKEADAIGMESVARAETAAPVLMTTGTIAGQMEDVLYGLYTDTTLGMKLKSSYCQEGVTDAEVLSTIEGPTLDEPFRFLGVKWLAQQHGSAAGAASSSFVKRHGLLFLESTGITTTTRGEQLGYHIVHSVNLRSLAHLGSTSASIVRAKLSMCQLFRQKSSGSSIDVFVKGFYDPQGEMMQFVATNIAADLMLNTVSSTLECAHLKKLAWQAHQTMRRRRMSRAATMAPSAACGVCERKTGGMLQRSHVACTMCSQMVCARCSVMKRLSFSMGNQDSSTDAATRSVSEQSGSRCPDMANATRLAAPTLLNDVCQKSLAFCLPCIMQANKQPAGTVACEELLERHGHGEFDVTSLRSSTRRRATTGSTGSTRITQSSRGSAPCTRPKAVSNSSSTSTVSSTSSVMLYVEEARAVPPASS